MHRKQIWIISLMLIFLTFFVGAEAAPISYDDPDNWVYYGGQSQDIRKVDVFFVCPTVFFGNEDKPNMPIKDAAIRTNFIGATNMEKGIYDQDANFYAPYYRQAGLQVYKLNSLKTAPYFDMAYQDVKAAFTYYLQHANHGRPIVLAGFSQGADMIIRLMKDMYQDKRLQEQLVAAYVIGWRITPEDIRCYPHLKMAKGETDTGVIISFNTEAIHVGRSVLVPEKTLGINPLNWQTTSEPADRLLNKGAVFTGYDGEIIKEISYLTGAYLDPARGTLKVTDINEKDYPPLLALFESGVYHVYDYQFFYRNLQQNIRVRINAYRNTHHVVE